MDTDSSYVALAGPLHSLVPDSLLEEFLDNYDRWYVQPFCPDHKEAFKCCVRRREEWSTTNECCRVYQLWDSRTPGKFKVEFQGSVICALNAKTYICHKEGSDQTQSATKLSSKGLSKRTNRLTVEDYKKVLADRTPVRGINTGFVRKNNTTYTYKQIKTGLTYFYCKRRVLPDGVSTTHIGIALGFQLMLTHFTLFHIYFITACLHIFIPYHLYFIDAHLYIFHYCK